ncbi:MAG: M56 family metallopeptidase, partial [Acidobacteria bacterium]|nr:M56 family metallopeptidase [Acidobacteriota bacterium]
LSPEELRPVILHELGHLRRWDDWTNLAQRVVRALLFFHPAVWWIDSRLSLEREMACDDLVLSRTGNARAYAECLVALAEKAAARSGMALALAAVSRMRQTATRLARILEHNRLVETRLSRPAVAVVALVGSAALIALPRTPALIAFQSATSATSTSAMSVREAGTSMLRPASYRVEQGVPHVVPAMLRADDSARFAGKRRGQLHKKAAGQAANRNRTKSALLTQASMRASEQSSPTFLLVVETSDDFIGVSHVWTLCVWRVPYSPNSGSTARQRQQEEIVSKSI